MTNKRTWTIYIAQDKHLDYNWCGTQAEIEVRMAALLDGYLSLAEQDKSRWNMDCTWWVDVYERQRGKEGVRRLGKQLKRGWLGCAANTGVMLWGLLNTELSIYAYLGSLKVAEMAGAPLDVALIEENPGMPASVANTLSACGIPYLGRGIYDLRAKSYIRLRQPYPLFWWLAPDGKRILVHWDLCDDNYSWGGYSEAFQIARIAGEQWDAMAVQEIGDRNTDEVYAKRVDFIIKTIERYEAYGENYPVSSILLLGTGWDNWTITDDYALFIERFNTESDGSIRLLDACYADYFKAVGAEIDEKTLSIPVLTGSFGVTWEEWAAHLAASTRDFRQASRLLVHAQAQYALDWIMGKAGEMTRIALNQGIEACLRFAEHDFGGVDRRTAAISAGVRAGAVAEANTIYSALSPVREEQAAFLTREIREENTVFLWQSWKVSFDPARCAVTSLLDLAGREWLPQACGVALGSFVHTLHHEDQLPDTVLPDSLFHDENPKLDILTCRRGDNGVEIRASGQRWGFSVDTRWFFHQDQPWIDITYNLSDGWTEAPQSVQFCFPFNLPDPVYTYDMAGAVLRTGPVHEGGDDLPGGNQILYAVQNFAQITTTDGDTARGVILLCPDAPLVQFGGTQTNLPGVVLSDTPAAVISMPMMNLTRNDWQYNQGGQSSWQFRYRIILNSHDVSEDPLNPLFPLQQAQFFAVAPFLQVPGTAPVIPGMADLHINFPGGPVTALKVAEDGVRFVIRFWNIQEHPVSGTLKLPEGFTGAEVIDAMERHLYEADITDGFVTFTAPQRSLFTMALLRN